MENLIEKTYDLAFLVYDSEKHTSVWNVKMVNWLCAPGTTTTVLEFFFRRFPPRSQCLNVISFHRYDSIKL